MSSLNGWFWLPVITPLKQTFDRQVSEKATAQAQ